MNHTRLQYGFIALTFLVATAALYRAEHKPPQRTVVLASQPAPAAKASRLAWPGLGQALTIQVGEALQGAPGKPAIAIYCNSPDCDLLAHDLDDAFQIADWPSDFERAYVDAQSQPGLFVGPPGDPAAQAIMRALARLNPQPADMPGPGIIIGRKP